MTLGEAGEAGRRLCRSAAGAPAVPAGVGFLVLQSQRPPGGGGARGCAGTGGWRPPRTVLDYAREKLFDPLGISTRTAFSGPLPDFFAPEFVKAGFGWGTDPDGIQLGGFGLRLTAPDMLKIGELYRRDGVWNGQQIVPADWIQQSIAPSTLNKEYGLLWWIINEPEGAGYVASGMRRAADRRAGPNRER